MSFLGDPALIAFFTTRAQEYAAVQAQVAQQARGASLGGPTNVVGPAVSQSRTISLTLSQNGTTVAPGSIVFDVALLSSDGFAQRISYSQTARQTTHHTPAGYYTDEVGLAPGEFSIDAEVVFIQGAATQIQKFFQLLSAAKAQSPLLSPAPPYKLVLTDTYLGRSYVVTQRDLAVVQSVDALNRARIQMSGLILLDYSGGGTPPLPATITTTDNFASTLLTPLDGGTSGGTA